MAENERAAMSFASRYDGECGDCGEPIHRGQYITYNGDDEVCHEHCPKPVKVCVACNLAHVGECD